VSKDEYISVTYVAITSRIWHCSVTIICVV